MSVINDSTNKETAATSGRREFLKAAGAAAAFSGAIAVSAAQAAVRPPVASVASSGKLVAADPAVDFSKLTRVKQELVQPPMLPVHEQVASGPPKIVEVVVTIEEKKMVLDDDGAEVWALTYNGSVPGPMIVVHEGDYVEVTLRNPKTSMMEHNIDFHAATGALGGGAISVVSPGEEVVFRWKAVKAGVFVYHCAPGGVMIPYHVCHGMNGAIMVLPREGLADGKGNPIHYDRAYLIGEQDYYLPRDQTGTFKKYEIAGEDLSDSLEVMRKLIPTHVVFNGRVGSLTGDGALKAKVGETVLFVHAQANRDSRPHLIGGHGDYVWETGSFHDLPSTGLETWFIRGGSAGAMAYKFQQPGLYAYVNHNLIEAVLLGATAHVVVEGDWNDDLMMELSKAHPFES